MTEDNQESLIMRLEFEEGSGSRAADTSPAGSDNAGQLRNGAEFRAEEGGVGGVVEFDGDNDYINIASAEEFNRSQQAKRTV
ncbi:MAG: hypothetical protein ACFB4I_25170, partial [Cyanophyceae cyanobacterium]